MVESTPKPTYTTANLLALAAAVVATVNDWTWFWGVVCLAVGLDGIRRDRAMALTPIDRRQAPWSWAAATVVWLFIGAWFCAYPWLAMALRGRS